MTLSSNTILQIDATVIAGLIILLTLQSVSSPSWQKQVDEYSSTSLNLGIQIGAINDMITEYCSENSTSSSKSVLGNITNIQTKCNEWALQSDELDKQVENLNKFGKYSGFNVNGTFVPSVSTTNGIRANFLVDQVSIVIIVLFGISALTEIASKFNKTPEQDASRTSMAFTLMGFGTLVIGFIFISYMMVCSNPFSVQNWCTRF